MVAPFGPNSGDVTVVIDPQKLAELMRSPQGPVIRRLIEDGEVVKQGAQRRVGVYRPPDSYAASHRTRKPGTLRDSIVKRVTSDGQGTYVEVGSADPIALLHHEGTEPHEITPSRAPRLVFFWPKVGHVVSLMRVSHPGTRPNRYLTDSLQDLRRRY